MKKRGGQASAREGGAVAGLGTECVGDLQAPGRNTLLFPVSHEVGVREHLESVEWVLLL